MVVESVVEDLELVVIGETGFCAVQRPPCLRVRNSVVLVFEHRAIRSRVSHGTQGHNKATAPKGIIKTRS